MIQVNLFSWINQSLLFDEEEDYILKSPMKRIHRIKTPIEIKPAFSEEQIELIRKNASVVRVLF
ncbi:MAG: hypothetical protein PUC37_10170 [Spirochaetales bacterium]|nr:hypothetical protein [Spirochaetales bacterium]